MVHFQVSQLISLLVLCLSPALSSDDASNSERPFYLTVTPKEINRHTVSKMTVRCGPSSNIPTRITRVFRIRILKESDDGWDMLAEQRDNEISPTIGGNLTASAKVGDVSKTFLQVAWEDVQDESFGVFKCEVIGFDSRQNTVTVQTKEVQIRETGIPYEYFVKISKEAQETVVQLEKFAKSEIALLKTEVLEVESSVLLFETNQSRIQDSFSEFETMNTSFQKRLAVLETTQSSFQSITSVLQSEQAGFENTVTGLEAKLASVKGSLDSLARKQSACEINLSKVQTFQDSLVQWPGGYYALLQPRSGCPVDLAFFSGTHRYQKVHTEEEDTTDTHSSAFLPTTKFHANHKNFMTIELCEVTRVFNSASWPSGSFCIHQLVHKPCPSGFSGGSMFFDTEDRSHSSEGRNNIGYGGRNLKLFFCCKRSGSTSTPMTLPTSSPFFLYRYGGTCQAVRNMRYTEEHIRFDTEDKNNEDKVSGRYPDVSNSGSYIIFRLCYYTKG